MPVHGRRLGKELMDMLGIDVPNVRSITIECSVDAVALATIECYPDPNVPETVTHRYAITEIEDA
jgi:hypothetical protein